eukprot:CAMPEP_0115861306 /NCGR_PEP_ID=MMETSP0287-20121206/17584_1 /TAXON_ID=412157 /ORGANISM="Chrysochromulina rotalis, Strain UIO044" /LENGTH=291 /DNA_ID=CAMNT_0003315675 /DNA_START=52 /DNA_END=927 /DNA_ORIENTATION=+
MQDAELRAAHWSNWMYRHTARHWHSVWCRFTATAELKLKFNAERIFTPTEAGDGTDMQVIYHYGDERGTVTEGPQCGPWRITEADHSGSDGLLHPASADMATLCLPGGPAAWCMKKSPTGSACAVELFLHHGERYRMSAGVIHSPDGSLMQLSTIREDSLGPVSPGDIWSASNDAKVSDAAGLAAALQQAGAPISHPGVGYAITAGLEQRELSADWHSTRMANAGAGDVVLLCADNIAIVAPVQRTEGEEFSSAAAWWPYVSGEAPILYAIEAQWDAQGALVSIQHLCFGA